MLKRASDLGVTASRCSGDARYPDRRRRNCASSTTNALTLGLREGFSSPAMGRFFPAIKCSACFLSHHDRSARSCFRRPVSRHHHASTTRKRVHAAQDATWPSTRARKSLVPISRTSADRWIKSSRPSGGMKASISLSVHRHSLPGMISEPRNAFSADWHTQSPHHFAASRSRPAVFPPAAR